jgi:hypothetical protein
MELRLVKSTRKDQFAEMLNWKIKRIVNELWKRNGMATDLSEKLERA